MKNSRVHRLFTLFFSMLYISAFTFGGGFVIVTFMKRKFVDELHWIDDQEMLDMTALAQSSPGAIAVNAAILVGWKTAGPAGMAAAVLGTVLPELLPMAGFDQRNYHHIYDVLEHTARVLESVPPEPRLRWAALFHDAGKPAGNLFHRLHMFDLQSGGGQDGRHLLSRQVEFQIILQPVE